MKALKTAALAAIFGILITVAHAQSWKTNGLVAYYPLNGNAIDESGNGNNGTINTITVAADRFGRTGGSLSFAGHTSPPIPPTGTSLVTLPAGSLHLEGSAEATVSLWCRANQTNSTFQMLFQTCPYVYYVPPPSPWGLGFGIAEGGRLNVFTASDSDRNFSTTTMSPGRWYHLVVVYNGAASNYTDKIRIYVNGIRDAVEQVRPEVIPANIPITANAAFLGAGHFKATGEFVEFLDGDMDDVRIYNRALSASEIASLYQYESTPPVPPTNGLIAYYPFNGNANDQSGNGNNATANGTFYYTNAFHNSSGISLIGDHTGYYSGGGYVSLPDLTGKISNSLTITFWVYLLDEIPDEYPIFFGTANYGQKHLELDCRNGFYIDDGFGQKNIPGTFTNIHGVWKQFAITYRPGEFAGYVDGQNAGTTNVTMASLPLYPGGIGWHTWVGGSSARTSWIFSNVRIYNRALSSSEIANLYQYESIPPVPPTNGLIAYYPFNGNANDESGNGNNGINSGATFVNDRFGRTTQSASFAVGNANIECPTLSSIPYFPVTYSLWFKLDAYPDPSELSPDRGGGVMTLIGRDSCGYFYQGALVLYNERNDVANPLTNTFVYYSGNTGVPSGYDPSTNIWHQLIYTFDNERLASFYLDGRLLRTETFLSPQNAVLPFRIGASALPEGYRQSWRGALDDVRIYNRALSSSEVQQLYAYESTPISNDPPAIVTQPQSQTVLVGTNVEMTVSVSGAPPFIYQWKFNGANIAGATSSNLVLTNVQMEATGDYTVAITNAVGYAVSDPATLTVLAGPTITTQPLGQTAYWGKSVTFRVVATGTAPIGCQWVKDGYPISFGTNTTLTLNNLDLTDAGNYTAVLSNVVNSVTSAPALLIVNPAGITLGMYPGVTIEGVIGKTYGIQYSIGVTATNTWTPLTNLTLTQPVQLWVDTSVDVYSPGAQRRYYRVVPIR